CGEEQIPLTEVTRTHQIRMQPGNEKVTSVAERQGHKQNGPEVSGAHGGSPWNSMPGAFRRPNLAQLRWCDTPFPFRSVSEPEEPHGRPHHAHESKYIERDSPTVTRLNGYDQQWAKRASDLHRHGKAAQHSPAFAGREPRRYAGCCIWKSSRVSGG